MSNAAPNTGPLALDRCMAVLGQLAASPDGATLTVLARAIGAPKSSLLSILRGLTGSGHVMEQGFVYRLGPAMLMLANTIIDSQRPLEEIAAPVLRRLTADAGETSILAIMTADGRATRYIAKVENGSALRFAASVGDRRPIHATASGLLLAAYRDDAWIESFLQDARLDAITDTTEVDPARLWSMLRQVRHDGVAVSNGSMTEGVTGLAVPVRDSQGVVRAALLLGGPSARMQQEMERLRICLLRNADDLSGLPPALFDRATD